jgi:hypothetical protein
MIVSKLNIITGFTLILGTLFFSLYFLVFYSEIWELDIEVKQSELDRISDEEKAKIVKFKKECEKAKKRISFLIRKV